MKATGKNNQQGLYKPYPLFLFSNEKAVKKAAIMIEEKYHAKIDQLLPCSPSDPAISCIQSAYAFERAWTPFINCGCNPQDLRLILQCNALACILSSFLYIASDPHHIMYTFANDTNTQAKDLLSHFDCIRQKLKSNKWRNYSYCLISQCYRNKHVKGGKSFYPLAKSLLSDTLKEKKEEQFGEQCRSLCLATNNYYYNYADSKQDSKRQKRYRLLSAYDAFYDSLHKIVKTISWNPESVEAAVNELRFEQIFHYHALSRSERDMAKLDSYSTLEQAEKVNSISMTLYNIAQIPLIFGMESISFSSVQSFGQYFDFIRLAAAGYYCMANQNIEKACEIVSKCLMDERFKRFLTVERDLPEKPYIGNLRPDIRAQQAITVSDIFFNIPEAESKRFQPAIALDELYRIVPAEETTPTIQVSMETEISEKRIVVVNPKFSVDARIYAFEFEDEHTRDKCLNQIDKFIPAILSHLSNSKPIILCIPRSEEEHEHSAQTNES